MSAFRNTRKGTEAKLHLFVMSSSD